MLHDVLGKVGDGGIGKKVGLERMLSVDWDPQAKRGRRKPEVEGDDGFD